MNNSIESENPLFKERETKTRDYKTCWRKQRPEPSKWGKQVAESEKGEKISNRYLGSKMMYFP